MLEPDHGTQRCRASAARSIAAPSASLQMRSRRRGQKRRRHVEAERLRHDQVNDEVELGRLLDRKIGGLRPPQNLVD